MRTNGILTFEGLKFKNTEFNFRSKKEMNTFFDNALIDSPERFINLMDRRTIENMHIAFSKYIVSKIASFIILGLAFVSILASVSAFIVISLVGLAVISFLTSKINEKLLDNLNFSRGEFDKMSESDCLEEVRQDLIKERNK